jgi:TPR repeat protein
LGLVTVEKGALKWFKMAVEGGGVYAQCRLEDSYENGDFGLTVNLKEALEWFKKAADLGHAINLEVALMWLQKAAGGEGGDIFYAI